MNFPQGPDLFGPILTGVGHNGFTMRLDMTGALNPVDFQMQYAEDGVNFVTLSTESQITAAGCLNHDGSPMVPPIEEWSPELGELNDVPNLTNAASKVQILVISGAAWHSPGGTITVI